VVTDESWKDDMQTDMWWTGLETGIETKRRCILWEGCVYRGGPKGHPLPKAGK